MKLKQSRQGEDGAIHRSLSFSPFLLISQLKVGRAGGMCIHQEVKQRQSSLCESFHGARVSYEIRLCHFGGCTVKCTFIQTGIVQNNSKIHINNSISKFIYFELH